MPLQDARATARASVGAADRTRHELFAHGAQIAAFLSHANPTAWPLRATTMMMEDHLNLTTTEAVDELNGRWAASVADYDKVEAEILMMSDTLSDGIIGQYPGRFAT